MSNFFGRNLKRLRGERGLSQAQLGVALHKGQKTIGNWETGYSEPSINELISVSNFFGIDISDMLKHELSHESPESKATGEWNWKKINLSVNLNEIKHVLKQEVSGCNQTPNDEITWRDKYIAILENKLCEASSENVSQQTFQDVISRLFALQEIVLELATIAPGTTNKTLLTELSTTENEIRT